MDHSVPPTQINFTMGSAMLLSALSLLLCGSLLLTRPSGNQYKLGKVSSSGSISDMSPIEAEEAFGPVNQSAAMEAKHGLFGRLLARRSACQSTSSCSSQSWNQTAGTQRCGTSSYRQYGAESVTYSQPEVASNCSDGICYPEIQYQKGPNYYPVGPNGMPNYYPTTPVVHHWAPMPLRNGNCANGTCHPAIPQAPQPVPQTQKTVPHVTKTDELRIVPSI